MPQSPSDATGQVCGQARCRLNRRRSSCNPVATPPVELWAQEKTMNRARLLMFAALAVACAGFLTLSQPADVGLMDRPAHVATALAAIR